MPPSPLLLLPLALPLPASGVQLASGVQAWRSEQPLTSAWFGPPVDAESSTDGTTDHRPGVWDVHPENPHAASKHSHSAAWYHEAPSGAWKEAWQTHFPAPGPSGAWRFVGGEWHQEYQHAAPLSPTVLRPEWFDASVLNRDGFGRLRPPDPGSPRRELFWQERSINTTLTCDTVNCTGMSLLQAFDPSSEEASHCRLSLFLHPTDFDDAYSGERLAWVRVNEHLVNTDCYPMISGCNRSAQMPLYPCLQDLPLTGILDGTGTLSVSAQISETVDECPFEGHLLAAVPMVTCQVSPRRQEPALQEAKPELPLGGALQAEAPSRFVPVAAAVPLRCAERGCMAHGSIVPSLELSAHVRSFRVNCTMNLLLYQTDFDGEQGTRELLEYVKVNGTSVLADFSPGGNPCRSSWAGQELSEDKKYLFPLKDVDVTELFLLEGGVTVEAKITDAVDECAHNGYLLDAQLELRCGLDESRDYLTTPLPTTTAAPWTTAAPKMPPLQRMPDLPPLEALVTPAPSPAAEPSSPAPPVAASLASPPAAAAASGTARAGEPSSAAAASARQMLEEAVKEAAAAAPAAPASARRRLEEAIEEAEALTRQ